MAARAIKADVLALPVAPQCMHTLFILISDVVLQEPPGVPAILSQQSKVVIFSRHGDARGTSFLLRTHIMPPCQFRPWFLNVRDVTFLDVAVAPRVDRCHNKPCLQSVFHLGNNFKVDERCDMKPVGNQQRPNYSPREIKKTQLGVKLEALTIHCNVAGQTQATRS